MVNNAGRVASFYDADTVLRDYKFTKFGKIDRMLIVPVNRPAATSDGQIAHCRGAYETGMCRHERPFEGINFNAIYYWIAFVQAEPLTQTS